jgi:dipeptidyl aminopeptidase/acylaminoacyl peptidase
MRVQLRRPLLLAPLLALVLAAAAAAQEEVLTPDLILTIRQVTDVQIAPDGSRVIVQVSRPRTADERPGGAIPELWILPTSGGDPTRFTTNEDGDRSPQWSPDGRSIAFLSRRAGSEFTQVHVIPASGGEARRLTSAPNNVGSFKWSRDGSTIAYTVTDPKTREELEAERQGKDWVVVDRNYKHTRLHAIDIASRKSHVVTQADVTVHDYDWAPDGARLLVMTAPTPTVDDSFMRLSIQTVPASGGTPTLVTKTEGKLSHPRWSPDGKWIAWLGAVQLNDPFAGSVFLAPAGGGAAENLTPKWEGTGTWLGWLPGEGSTIALVATERQDTKVYTLSVADRTRRPIDTGAVTLLAGLSFTSDGRRLAYPASTPTHPNDAFATALGTPGATRLTTLNPQLQSVQLGEQEVVRWKARDGWDIEGVLVKPVGYRAGQRYPVIMQPHGGPEAADLNGWLGTHTRWGQMLAGRGYAVFYPNYRGSIGRGPAFAMGDHRDLMGREFEDMLDGLDHLVKVGIADPTRIGVGGGSYGGYTSAWAGTYASERFRAAVMWMGISNWISMTGTADIFYENSTVHWDLMMYENNNYEIYWERSPLKHIQNANTPMLIIHGAVDPRVPIGQSEEMYTALKWKGVPVEFVRYPRAGHGVTERAHQEDFMNRVIAWFDKYVKTAGMTNQ